MRTERARPVIAALLIGACMVALPAAQSANAGDAFAERPKLTGEFDFVFLDAWKRDDKRFFDMVFPRLRPGGLFLAHNVVNKRNEMGDFPAAIENNPMAFSSIASPSGEGMSVTVKLGPRHP